MKLAAIAVLLVATGAALAQPPARTADLRQQLRQYHPASTVQARQLTPAEREQLRRQLAEQAQPHGSRRK